MNKHDKNKKKKIQEKQKAKFEKLIDYKYKTQQDTRNKRLIDTTNVINKIPPTPLKRK